jgi:hypothetical protein
MGRYLFGFEEFCSGVIPKVVYTPLRTEDSGKVKWLQLPWLMYPQKLT